MPARALTIAITVGDPRGIGPEIARAILPLDGVEAMVFGPADVVRGWPARLVEVGTWEGGGATPEAHAGALTAHAVEAAVQFWREGRVDAIVTGPGSKQALHAAGYRYPGHTELLKELTGARDVAMMLASDRLRVALVTTHLPLRDALAILTPERIVKTAEVVRSGLQDWFGIAEPRLALCAVNPHAGEGGLFGDEETRALAPAAGLARLAGPLPADTVFVRALNGEFDCVLAPYHDVGMTAIKVASFGKAVNVTLGLPVPRTAPDHGTAFDIAGRGIADPASMRQAAAVATAIARRLRRE
ncbi:MAG TPA: 4-hydroxythreonine-4-phosphate dehydrogenase PdxA [Gemmatimonadales bacterium]|nr:4-hydroxythreonine-4-phosphate dehydrogenase PdxA [Gemmatimonadales bacterium]